MSLEFGVLGPIEVRRDGEAIPLGGPQQRRVVAALVADLGRVVPVDRLVDAVWPEVPPDGARRTVMTYVSRLRLAVGDGCVVTQEPGYRLDAAPDAVDAARFEQLLDRARQAPPTQSVALIDAALELWRGPAFGEFAAEWWALPHASRLEELRIGAAEQRAEARIATGEHDGAVADLERLVAAYPLRERAVTGLMRAYEASGRQAEALRVYGRYRDRLAEETGLEPSAALREVESAIARGAGGSGSRSMRSYVLEELIGEGAFGSVYRSVQPGVGRDVAIKVIRAELADDPAFIRRFEAEAQLVAHLEHPHIVPLYDFWREPGGAFLVFRLLRGGTAEGLIEREGALDLERVDELVTSIGDALVTAHAAGVVHRDVKPANVLFDDAGNPYLADFGIATVGAAGDDDTPSVVSAGSPLYAAPEQFQRVAASPLLDQYSFGVTVWELLAGRAAFDGATPSTILRRKLERPVEPLDDVPRAVDAVLQRATASRPEDRFVDVSSLLDAWRTAVRASAGTTGDLEAGPKPSGRPGRLSSTAAALVGEVANPYQGMRAFGEADVRHFRGRDALAARLADEVHERTFVTVVGPSGSGKSSLVHAGLVPRLRARGLRVTSMVPGDDPVGQLRTSLLAVAADEPAAGGVETMVASVAAQAPEALVVVIDQFEELWTLTEAGRREAFARGLARLVADAGANVRVVVTLRADFFDRPLADAALGPLVADRPFAVIPMTTAELHDAVVGPAGAVGVAFEPGLDTTIVSEVANQPASLPLLQFTLAELFEQRQGLVIPRSAYDAMGGIAGAIASRAEEAYAALDATEQAAARRLLLRLVVPGDAGGDTRRRLPYRDLPPGGLALAERFEDHRLLVADRDALTREPTVEVAHESLLQSWPRLRRWLDEDRDDLRRLQHLGESAAAWVAAGRLDAELYRGARLDAARDLLDRRPEQLNALEREFVVAGVEAAANEQVREQRNRGRLRRGLVATTVALVLALLAGSIALVQRNDAKTEADAADVARLVSLSQSLTSSKRDVALLLAAEAATREPGPVTTGALQAALYADPHFLRYVRTGTSSSASFAFAPDGRSIFVSPQAFAQRPVQVDLASGATRPVPVVLDADTGVDAFVPIDDRSALLIRTHRSPSGPVPVERVDLSDGRVLGTATVGGDAGSISLSPDHERVAVTTLGRAGTRSRVVVLDAATLEKRATVEQPGPAYDGEGDWFSFATWIDDDRLAVGSPSGSVIVWSPSDGSVRLINDPPAPGTGDAGRVLVTPDAKTLVVDGLVRSGLMAYDLATGEPVWPAPQPAAFAVAIDPIGNLVWAQEAGFGSSRMFSYDLATGVRTGRQLDGQHGTVCEAKVSPAGTTLVTTSCNEGVVALWSLDASTAIGAPLEAAGWGSSLELWSPDGNYVVLFRVDDPATVEVLDVRDGTRIPAPGISASAVDAPIWRPDGVLQTLDEATNHVIEFDPRTRQRRDTGVELAGTDLQSNVAWRDGRSIYGMADGTIDVVDTVRGKVDPIEAESPGIAGVGFSRDGRRVFAAGQDEKAAVYDIASGKKVAELPTPAGNLIENPAGTLMATAAFNGTVRFYDTATLREVGDPLSGVSAFPAQLQFTPDGRTLITSGLDNTMHFFDVASRREIGTPLEISGWGAAVSPGAASLGITTPLGVERLSLDRGRLRAAACRAAGRDLSPAEWSQYLGGAVHRVCRVS